VQTCIWPSSCFSKIQIGFSFLLPAHPGSPGKKPLNWCVCVCVYNDGNIWSDTKHPTTFYRLLKTATDDSNGELSTGKNELLL